METLNQKAYKIAQKDLGQKEVAGIKANNPRIIQYLKAVPFSPEITLNDEIPWCSAAMNCWIQEAGGHGTKSGLARSWLTWGVPVPVAEAKEGDIIIFSRGKDRWSGHVAFFVKEEGLFMRCLGGNQSDQVSYALYRKSKILGIRRAKA